MMRLLNALHGGMVGRCVCRIEAAIIRVMKMRKELAHPALMAEVIKQLSMRFEPSPKVMLQCRRWTAVDRLL